MRVTRIDLLVTLLLLIIISIIVGPLISVFFSPATVLATERLTDYSSATPYLIAIYVVAAVATGCLSRYLIEERKALIPLLGLWLTMLFSSVIHSNADNITLNIPYIGAILFYVTTVGLLRDFPQTHYKVSSVYILASGVVSVIYLLFLQTPFAPESNGRVFFMGENPNSYSTRMALSITMTLFLIPETRKKYLRYIYLALLPSQLIVTYMSGSRGAILMLGLAFLVFLFYQRTRSTEKAISSILLLGLILISGGILVFSNEISDISTAERMLSLFESGDEGRKSLWKETLSIFADNPIIGVGPNGFANEMMLRYEEVRDAHNIFVFLLASSGILGTFCFLAFFVPLTKDVLKRGASDSRGIALLLIMFLFMLKSGGILAYSLMWLVFALVRVKPTPKKR